MLISDLMPALLCALYTINRYTFGAFLTWQWLSLVCGFVPLVFIVFMIFMPESPWYTLVQGQIQDATDALCWLRGTEDPELVQDELRDVILMLIMYLG